MTTFAPRLLAAALLISALALPASAQQADTVHVDGKTIIVEDGGRVVIDGEEVGDGAVIHLDDGRIIVRRHRDGAPRVWRFGDDDAFRFRLDDDAFRFEHRDLERAMDALHGAMDNVRVLDIEGVGGHMGRVLERMEMDRELMKLEREAHEMARELREAEGREARELEQRLRRHLEQILDRKLTLQAERLERMEVELREQRERLAERRRHRDEIIERRLRELRGEDDVLDW